MVAVAFERRFPPPREHSSRSDATMLGVAERRLEFGHFSGDAKQRCRRTAVTRPGIPTGFRLKAQGCAAVAPKRRFGAPRRRKARATLGKRAPSQRPTPLGEWHLDKSILFFGSGDAAAFVSAPAIDILMAGFFESGIFRAFFDGPRLASSGPFGDQICGQRREELLPELGSFSFVSRRASDFGDGLSPFAEGIEGTFEADPFQLDLFVLGGLGHNPTQQVMSGEEDKQFSLHHGRGPAA